MAAATAAATAASSRKCCLSCGDLAVAGDRRVLGRGSGSDTVTSLWKELITKELERRNKQLDIDSLISQEEGYVCRKCFHAYDKLLKNTEVLVSKMSRAVSVITSDCEIVPFDTRRSNRQQKRPCANLDTAYPPSAKRKASQPPQMLASTPQRSLPASSLHSSFVVSPISILPFSVPLCTPTSVNTLPAASFSAHSSNLSSTHGPDGSESEVDGRTGTENTASGTGSTVVTPSSAPLLSPVPPSSIPSTVVPANSPNVSINVEYQKGVRKFVLTPSRKHMGKAVARRSKNAIVRELLENPVTKSYVVKKIGVLVRKELVLMCSEKTKSVLSSQSISDLKAFNWKALLAELSSSAPILLSILQSCTHTGKPRVNQDGVIGMCCAILLKFRYQKMCIVQKILSLILYAGNSGKHVYERLQKVQLSMSHVATNRLLNKVGVGHDAEVNKWRDEFVAILKDGFTQGNEGTEPVCRGILEDEEDEAVMESSSSESWSSSSSDSFSSCGDSIPAPQFSPLTSNTSSSDAEAEESEQCPLIPSPERGGIGKECVATLKNALTQSTEETESVCSRVLGNKEDEEIMESESSPDDSSSDSVSNYDGTVVAEELVQVNNPTGVSHSQPISKQLGYKLVGDNVDGSDKARFLRLKGCQDQDHSYHCFHFCGIRNRIDHSRYPDVHPDTCLDSPLCRAKLLLPSKRDDTALRNEIAILVSRVLTDHMPYFKHTFDGIVDWHIKHKYYSEMSTKSDVVPLGVLMKNENKGEDMVEIMSHLHRYVPSIEREKTQYVTGSGEEVEVSEVNTKKILFGGDQLTAARARGAKRARANSLSGTTRLEGLTPCAEDWHAKLNLLDVVWKYFYSAASAGDHGTMYQLRNMIGRSNVSGDPIHKYNEADDFYKLLVTCYILVAAMKHLKMKALNEIPSHGNIKDPQNLWAKTAKKRKSVLTNICSEIVDEFACFEFNKLPMETDDKVLEYSKRFLGLGCFYLVYSDAIKEGDGERVLRCWRYLLPVFKSSGRKNYSIEVLNMLCQYEYELTPRQAQELIWSRFVSTHSAPGRNIPGDLHQEHLNRVVKDAIRGLRANKTEKAMTRVGKALGTLDPLLDNFDLVNMVSKPAGAHKIPGFGKDMELIVEHLKQCNIFTCQISFLFSQTKECFTLT